MNIQKELQNRIGELIGKDYSEYERECDCPSREEIIVKPEPSLNDVLMAIDTRRGMYHLDTDGSLFEWNINDGDCYILKIDLSKSLFNQDESTLQAIYNLLK